MQTNLYDRLIGEFEVFLHKSGMGTHTIRRYKTAFRAFLELLDEKGMAIDETDTDTFTQAYCAVDSKRRKHQLPTIRHFLAAQGLLHAEADVSSVQYTLNEVQAAYLHHLQSRGCKPGTITGAACDTGKFLDFCAEAGVHTTDQLSRKLVERFATSLFIADTGTMDYSAYCLNKKIIILYYLKNFLSYIFEDGKTLINLSAYIEVPKKEKQISRNFFKREEIVKFFAVIDTTTILGFMDRTMFEVLYGTGMRVSELCSLQTGDVNAEKATLFIRQGKGGKDRVVPLTQAAWRYLEVYLAHVRPRIIALAKRVYKQRTKTAHVFLTARGTQISEAVITMLILRYTADAGLLWESGVRKKRSAHSFRYSCATHMMENGADIRYIADLLGHRDIDTTAGYTRINPRNLVDVMQCHPRGREQSCPFRGVR